MVLILLVCKNNKPVADKLDIRIFVNFISSFWFYGISTIVGYLMPNSFLYIYIYEDH